MKHGNSAVMAQLRRNSDAFTLQTFNNKGDNIWVNLLIISKSTPYNARVEEKKEKREEKEEEEKKEEKTSSAAAIFCSDSDEARPATPPLPEACPAQNETLHRPFTRNAPCFAPVCTVVYRAPDRCKIIFSLYLCRRNLYHFSMKRTLTIRNFGAIRSARIELKDVNLFIGAQGSGKSTIAKLITIFDKQIAGSSVAENNFLKAQFAEFNIGSYLQSGTSICYEWENGKICVDATSTDQQQTSGPAHDVAIDLYIPAERFFVSTFSRSLATLMLAKAPIPQTLLEFASLYEKAKNKYPSYQVPMLNLTFQANEINETLLLKESGRSIPFKESSSGIQSVVPLLMVVDYAITESSFTRIIVEEPELNLFPQTQVDLLHYLISKCPQLTLTTHSPYLLSALNNLIEANNVLKLHPEKEKEVTQLIPKECILDFDNVAAYKIENGEVISIMDDEYRLIVADKIDEISDKEGRIFSELLNME